MKKLTVYFCVILILASCFSRTSFAGPITIFNGTAERLPKGKWVVEAHYGYYKMTVIKNTAYWGYAKGDDHLDSMSAYDMRYINNVLVSEIYYAFTDRVLVGGLFPYFIRDVKKQPFAQGEEVFSDGFGDIALRTCVNLFDPYENFLGVSLAGAVVFPSGDEDDDPPLGNGRYEFIAGVIFTKIFNEKIKAHVTLCYDWTMQNNAYKYWAMYSDINTGDEFHYGVVGEYALTDRLNLVCELNGWLAPESRDRYGNIIPYTDYHKIDICPGIQYRLNDNITFEAALEIPLKQDKDFDYSIAPVAGITWVF
jgi:hypothetical protein